MTDTFVNSQFTIHNSQLLDTLQGDLRRYHIEGLADENELGKTYRAYARRKAGDGVVRRYFAVLEKGEGVSQSNFNAAVKETILSAPFQIHKEETIEKDGHRYIVLAKGEEPRKVSPFLKSIQNKGYLMLFLAAFILILLIIRLFQSPEQQVPVVTDDHAIESVDL